MSKGQLLDWLSDMVVPALTQTWSGLLLHRALPKLIARSVPGADVEALWQFQDYPYVETIAT